MAEERERKKKVYLKRSPRVALLLQVTFILMHWSYPWILLVAESKGNIFGEYVDFRIEIIVKNYRVFLVVSPLVG